METILGFIIGLTWEFAFFFTGLEFSDDPVFTLIQEFPLPPILQPTLHTFWDGGIHYSLNLAKVKLP
jgi:hypothetical protein